MRFELRLMTAGALLLLLVAASCQQQAIAKDPPLPWERAGVRVSDAAG